MSPTHRLSPCRFGHPLSACLSFPPLLFLPWRDGCGCLRWRAPLFLIPSWSRLLSQPAPSLGFPPVSQAVCPSVLPAGHMIPAPIPAPYVPPLTDEVPPFDVLLSRNPETCCGGMRPCLVMNSFFRVLSSLLGHVPPRTLDRSYLVGFCHGSSVAELPRSFASMAWFAQSPASASVGVGRTRGW
jgi:hypothetical protein